MTKGIEKFFAIAIFFTLPLILANVYYIDDLGRAAYGYTNWGLDGRPLADLIMMVINLSINLTDISPLSIFISCLMISFGFLLFTKGITSNEKKSIFIPVSIFYSPFIFEIFSYRFDSITISASIMISFIFISLKIKSNLIKFLSNCLLVIMILCLYQATINLLLVFLILSFIDEIKNKVNEKTIIINTSIKLITIIIGSILYIKLILPFFNVDTNGMNHPGISNTLITQLSHNFVAYYGFIVNNIHPLYGKGILVFISLACIICSTIISIKYYLAKRTRLALMFIPATVIASAIAPFAGMAGMLILTNPVANFPRVYIGMSGLMVLFSYLIYYTFNNKFLYLFITSVLLLASLGYVYSYGNALKSQYSMDLEISNTIKSLTQEYDYDTLDLVFFGQEPRSLVLLNAKRNYPLIDVMVPTYFGNWIGPFKLMEMNGYKQLYPGYYTPKVNEALENRCTFPIFAKTQDFYIRKSGSTLIIDFSREKCH